MTPYDEIPYACQPIPCTAPEQLALASLLHGGPCPRFEGARYLEIGCGNCANLLPLAFFRPDCHFVGVDASGAQISDARQCAEDLALRNLSLHAADICEVGPGLGRFDYIVAHGVMSWVSDRVRDAIFALCRDQLAPEGLLYLSYNTYPGWLIRGLVRGAMLRPREVEETLLELAAGARERARALRSVIEDAAHPYAQLLSRELGHVDAAGDSSLLHDYLAEHNRAYWFSEFAALASTAGFHYLTEAAFTQPDYRVPAVLRDMARKLESDPHRIEELIDVLWYRQHRTSLFCRAGAEGAGPSADALFLRIHLAAGCRPGSDAVRLDRGIEETFDGLLEPNVSTTSSDPLEKAALATLAAAWPRGFRWRELVAESRRHIRESGVEEPDASAEASLRNAFVELHALGQLELRLRALPPATAPNERPALASLTRWEALRRKLISTPTHQRMALTITDQLIFERLTGEHTLAEIAAAVALQLRSGGSLHPRELLPADTEVPESLTLEQWVEARLAQVLELLAAWGLLR